MDSKYIFISHLFTNPHENDEKDEKNQMKIQLNVITFKWYSNILKCSLLACVDGVFPGLFIDAVKSWYWIGWHINRKYKKELNWLNGKHYDCSQAVSKSISFDLCIGFRFRLFQRWHSLIR